MKETFLIQIKRIFERDRVICRLVAAWCSFAALVFRDNIAFTSLGFAQDISIPRLILFTAAFFLLYSALAYIVDGYHTDSFALIAAATLCVIKWLIGYTNFLFTLAVIAAYLLFLFYFINVNRELISKINLDTRATFVFAIACGTLSAAVVAYITCLRYMTFSAPNYDFGIFCNMFHYMKETGLPMVTSERDALLSHFAVHISPIYYLLLPFYWIFPSPLTLQIGQAIVLGSGVIPVWLLCRHYGLSSKLNMALCAIYSFFPAISCGCFYDIHENCFLAPLLLWTFYFFERQKYIPMYIFALSVLLVKEDAAMYIIFFSLFVMLSRKKYLHGAILAVGALAYFGLSLFLLSEFGTGVMVNRFDNLIYNADEGLLGAIKTALVNPAYLLTQLFTTGAGGFEKLVYFIKMFLPLGFLPFCTRRASKWLLIAPVLMNLLTYYQYQYDINFQYQFGITAFLIYAMINNATELKAPTRNTLVTIGLVACCFIWVSSVVPLATHYRENWQTEKESYAQMEEVLDTIPEDASVNASTFLLPHISDREIIYEVAYHGDKTDVDYVVLDTRYSDYRKHMFAYEYAGYEVVEQEANILIMKKGQSS